jgi:hypothetical protein
MIHTQPVPTRRYNVTSVAARTAQGPVHCKATCPRCNSAVGRIHRRFIDRLVNLVYPIQRYRCQSFICRWEGNIADAAQPSGNKPFGAQPRAQAETWKWVQLPSSGAE